MSSIVIPGLDLAPSVPSRVVTVDVIDMTEGEPAAGAKIDFILPQDVHARSDGKVLKAGATTLTLDSKGHGEIRLPAYSDATKPEGWVILVKKHWAPYPYPIRVPVGSTKLSLAAINPPVEVSDSMSNFVVTDASASIKEGAQWGVSVDVSGGVADFQFTAPPGGAAFWRGGLLADADIGQLEPGAYAVSNQTVADSVGVPSAGTLIVGATSTGGTRWYLHYGLDAAHVTRWTTSGGLADWVLVGPQKDAARYKMLGSATDINTLPTGTYWVGSSATFESLGLPGSPAHGKLEIFAIGGAGGAVIWTPRNPEYESWTALRSNGQVQTFQPNRRNV